MLAFHAGRPVRLPRSSTRLGQGYVFCKLLTAIREAPMNAGWEGRIYPPGELIAAEELPDPAVVLECAGPQGGFKHGKRRETLWILWKLDREAGAWRELARATSLNWEWSLALRAPAMAALYPQPGLYDVLGRGVDVAERVAAAIDRELAGEPLPVRRNVWARLHDQSACRIAGFE